MNDVVKLSCLETGVAIVAMEDHESKNTFSNKLISGLLNTFDIIKRSPAIKVVVIHGYGNYFSCGGTKEELLKLCNGEISFTDLKFYDLLLQCEIPTIAALQGHAIGGGLAFAAFSDIMILAKESMYSTNFMKYGFTPGMGATYTIPAKFGNNIANEMLFCAKMYHGNELKEMGLPLRVTEKNNVISLALELANEISDKPISTIKALKKHMTMEIKAKLPEIIRRELSLHKRTFAQPEVKMRVEELFYN